MGFTVQTFTFDLANKPANVRSDQDADSQDPTNLYVDFFIVSFLFNPFIVSTYSVNNHELLQYEHMSFLRYQN